jgi:hypothetical protein
MKESTNHTVSPRLGLKHTLADAKGTSIRIKASLIRRELHYAWQRAWRGYDDQDIYDLCFRAEDRLLVLLREYRQKNTSLFMDTAILQPLSAHETDAIIDEMIHCLEMCNEEARLDVMCVTMPDAQQRQELYNETVTARHRLLELMEQWWTQLWL